MSVVIKNKVKEINKYLTPKKLKLITNLSKEIKYSDKLARLLLDISMPVVLTESSKIVLKVAGEIRTIVCLTNIYSSVKNLTLLYDQEESIYVKDILVYKEITNIGINILGVGVGVANTCVFSVTIISSSATAPLMVSIFALRILSICLENNNLSPKNLSKKIIKELSLEVISEFKLIQIVTGLEEIQLLFQLVRVHKKVVKNLRNEKLI